MTKTILMSNLSAERVERCLYYIRGGIIRDGLEGLEHVEALLVQYGLDPNVYRVQINALGGSQGAMGCAGLL